MAKVVSGLLTSAVVKIAGDKLSSAIAEQATLLWSFKDDLKDMKDTLESMKAVFVDAEKRSIKDEVVRLWMKRLKAAALDIVDMLDEYQDEPVKKSRMFSCLPIACKNIALANKMKNMRENLRKINEKWHSFNFTRCSDATLEQPHYDQRETTSDLNEAEIIGRDMEKKAIIDLLIAGESKKETVIVPIYGLGAMGKSTLARLVYNDTKFKEYDHRVWVYVSQVFDLRKIGRSIISQLTRDCQQNVDNLELINRHLDDLFCRKKVLIVLDDLWEERKTELDKLKTMLHVGKTGSTIDVIVTTRKEDIAKRICTNNESYRLQPLNDDICWDIIKRSSEFERKANKEQLEQIGLDIAKKCGGVALAAQALGYMLKSKDLVDDWSKMKKSDIWNDSGDDNENERVLPSLMLSYERMAPNLRLLFSYCAIFSKGHNIVEDDLIHQWSALDFIEPSEGKKYIKQLLGMSFLQNSRLLPLMHVDEVVRYTMHDLVHDLARSVIGDELALFENAKKDNTSEYCRYTLLTDYDGKTKLSDMLPNKVMALHFVGSSKLDLLPPGAFAFAKRLRILDFSGCSSIFLPASVGQLKQPRCLITYGYERT